MIKRLLSLTMWSALIMLSCKKETAQTTPAVPVNTIADIKIPADFTWENSRNINFVIGITDANYQNIIHVISIYDGDPAVSGKLLSKGSATTIAPFRSKIYLSNQIKAVYIMAAFPDGTISIQKTDLTSTEINMAIGI